MDNILINLLFRIKSNNQSILQGNASLAILICDLSSECDHNNIDEVSYMLCKSINSNIEKYSNCTLGNGLLGGLYAIGYLKKKGKINLEDDFFCEYDKFALLFAKNCLKNGNYDLYYGLLGVGLYYLILSEIDSKYEQKLDWIVQKIVDLSVEVNGNIYWRRMHDGGGLIFDWGLLHGIPSIISFLLIVYHTNPHFLKYESCIRKALKTMSDNMNVSTKNFSYFHMTGINLKYNFEFESRLGYCYGDLGVINTYLLASRYLNDKTYMTYAEQMINKLLFRIENYKEEVYNLNFCHGVSGILELLLKFNQYIEINEISSSIVRMRAEIENHLKGLDYEKFVPDLLDGDIGILFSYLSSSGYDLPGIERLLLIK